MSDNGADREQLVMQAVHEFYLFSKALDQRNSGRAARGEHPLKFDPFHGQGKILRSLAKTSGASQGKLAEELAISPQTLSISLKKLVRDGLVEQTRSDKDGRIRIVRLTEKGQQAKTLLDERAKYSGSMFEALDNNEIAHMVDMLAKLKLHLIDEIETADRAVEYFEPTGKDPATLHPAGPGF